MMRYLLAAIVACTLSAPGFAKSIDPEKTEEIMLKGEILAKLLGPESNWTRGGGLQPEYLAVAYKRNQLWLIFYVQEQLNLNHLSKLLFHQALDAQFYQPSEKLLLNYGFY